MLKTLKTWVAVAAIGVPTSIFLWWNAPRVINGDYWMLGFAMEGAAIAFYPAFGVCVFRKWKYAQSIAALIYSETRVWVSTAECLDAPVISRERALEILAVYKEDPSLFGSPIHLLTGEQSNEI